MEQPPGFLIYSNLVCRFKKLLYGLKKSPQAWYAKINSFFLQLGFKFFESDHNMYVLHTNGDTLIVVVYVDELLITGNNNDLILRLKKQLVDSFEMTYLGTLQYFLGLQVLPLCDGFFISRSKYVMDLLTHFTMVDCDPCDNPFYSGLMLSRTCQTSIIDATLYRQLVDCFSYLTHIRIDFSFVVSMVSWFMQDPK
jgi:hypothetical protein